VEVVMQRPSKQDAANKRPVGPIGQAPASHETVDDAQEAVEPDLDLHLDGRLVLDAQWQITDINTRALALLNCKMHVLQGFDLWDVVPDDVSDLYQAQTSNALLSSSHHAFVAHDKFEGSWIEFTFWKHSDGYIVNLRDVASIKKLQKRLDDSERTNQLIFEVNPNPMWVFDLRSLHILAANRAAVAFYGIAHKRFLTLTMNALFPEDDGAVLLDFLGNCKGSQSPRLDPLLCKQMKMDGQAVLVELACGHTSWNGYPAVLINLADVGGLPAMDRASKPALVDDDNDKDNELASLREQLKDTKFDMAALTYALSHDLRGPLHAANGFAALLFGKYAAALGDAGQHYVRRIQGSTRQMAKLVHYLLTLVQLPPVSATPEKIDLAPMCRDIIEDLRSGDTSRSVTVEIETSMPLVGDRDLLMTAMACLLENAWKFTSKKPEGWIKIGLHPFKVPGELVIRVMDNGAGFDPAYMGKLFTPFQRLHSSAEFPGNGLGLAIVKRVAERHGGAVWAETDHAGASFFMSLPQS
jgi:signal transduction histidine kinase/PAS domain-containing protein